jgi:predicted Zn-dependent protease
LALDIYLWMAIRPNTPEEIQVCRVDDLSKTTPLEAMSEHVSDRYVRATQPPVQSDKPSASAASVVSAPAKPTKPDKPAKPSTPKQSPEVAADRERPLDRSRPMELKVILAQIKAGNRDGAIADLLVLKDQRPDNAYLYLLLGNLYSEKRQWSQAIESYQLAVAKDPSYRFHKLLVGNTVLAIKDDLAYPAAKALIEKEIGPAAIPKLLPLAQRRTIPRLQERAQELIDHLSSIQQ